MARDDVRARIGAQIMPVTVEGVLVGADLLRLVHFWLGEHARDRQRRCGAVPVGLPETLLVLAEALGADSRRRESSASVSAGHVPAVSRRREFSGLLAAGEGELRVAEVGQLLGISASAVRYRCGKGTLPGRKVGGQWLVPAAAAMNK